MSAVEAWREKAVEVIALLVLGAGFVGLFLGVSWFWLIWVIGFAVLVPIVAILLDVDEEEDADVAAPTVAEENALQTLRDRYARGELTDEQFERKLERLLETEQLEDVEDRFREPERE